VTRVRRTLALLALLVAAAGPARALAAEHPTLPVIERQVMCVTCKIPLNVAQSPQADRERAFIQELIGRGDSEAQIKSALVEQYGPTVLGLPRARGFDLTAYLVPLAVVVALAVLLVLLLPRWRREGRARGDGASAPELSPTDSARLDSDLARFD
jgi:cytochrome c-type biogenesis protein CcmH